LLLETAAKAKRLTFVLSTEKYLVVSFWTISKFLGTHGELEKPKGAVHKRRPKSGGRDCPVRTFFGQEGSSDADICTIWWKNFGFFEIYGVSAQTRGRGL